MNCEIYCQKHHQPHLGFGDETTACIPCIEDILAKDGERIAGYFTMAISQSDKAVEIQQAIQSWLEDINLALPHVDLAELPLALQFLQTPRSLNIARTVVTYAQRMKMTPEEVIERVAREGAAIILPVELTEE